MQRTKFGFNQRKVRLPPPKLDNRIDAMIAALPSDWVITYQEVEELRAEAARLPAEIAALQDRLAIVRRKIEAVDFLIADKAQQCECPSPAEEEG